MSMSLTKVVCFTLVRYMARKRQQAKAAGQPDPWPGVNVTRAATFSGWFDMSESFPQYVARPFYLVVYWHHQFHPLNSSVLG